MKFLFKKIFKKNENPPQSKGALFLKYVTLRLGRESKQQGKLTYLFSFFYFLTSIFHQAINTILKYN